MKVFLHNLLHNFTLVDQAERDRVVDGRQHVCLYLLSPTGHGLKKHDIECLKRIQVVTIITKFVCCNMFYRILLTLCLVLAKQTV